MSTKKQQILEAVIDLHSKEIPAGCAIIAKTLGIKQSVVNDALKTLADDEVIYRVANGVYAPVAQHPPARQIWKAVLPDGTVKLDIGDDVLTLTPKEARILGGLFLAEATEYGSLALASRFAEMNNFVHNRLKCLEKEISKQDKTTQESLI